MHFPLTFPFKQVFLNIKEEYAEKRFMGKSFHFCLSKFNAEKCIPLISQ